jgi:small neutral amino acid transporter SnatA (MarC family)
VPAFKWSIRGILGGLFLVMAFLQLGGFLLIFFRFARVHAFSLLAGLVYAAIALMLLRRGRRRTD